MRLSDTAGQARARLEKQLADFGVPDKLFDEIVGHHTLVNYNKGCMVFLHGAPADLLFCVFAGLVKVYCPRPDGARIMVALAGPGDVIGQVDYLDSKGRLAQAFEAETLTKCSMALFTRQRVIKLLQSLNQETLLGMIERLNSAWSSNAQWFGTFLSMSFRERLEIVFKGLATKFGVRDTRGVLVMPELSHADFADMIGSSRPMVSRLITEMIEEGLLLRQGKQFIVLEPLDEKSDSPGKPGEQPDGSSEVLVRATVKRPVFGNSAAQTDGKVPFARVISTARAKQATGRLRI
jgi:CRP-like cAMP-binding protein